jgi:hypothetical protein
MRVYFKPHPSRYVRRVVPIFRYQMGSDVIAWKPFTTALDRYYRQRYRW